MKRRLSVLLVSGVLPIAAIAQPLQVTRETGAPVRTELGYGIALNKESSLQRQAFAIHNPALPAALEGTPGVGVVYESTRTSGDFKYATSYTVRAKEALSAVEVRFLVFNVFGELVRVLASTEIADVAAGSTKTHTAKWRLYSENEAAEHFSSVGYIARVRTGDGRVVETPRAAIVAEVAKLVRRIEEKELDPKKDSR